MALIKSFIFVFLIVSGGFAGGWVGAPNWLFPIFYIPAFAFVAWGIGSSIRPFFFMVLFLLLGSFWLFLIDELLAIPIEQKLIFFHVGMLSIILLLIAAEKTLSFFNR